MADPIDQAWDLACAGEVRAAHRIIRRVIREHPDSYQAKYVYAKVILDLGWEERAVDLLRRMHSEWPDEPHTSILLGRALMNALRHVEAQEILSEAVQANPGNKHARELLAWNQTMGNPWNGDSDFRALQEDGSDEIQILLFKADHFERTLRVKKAASLLKTISPLQESDIRVASALGELAIKQRNLPQATKHLMQCIELDPTAPQTVRLAGRLLIVNRNLQAARRWFGRLLVIPGYEARARWFLAWIAIRTGSLQEAEWHVRREEYLQPSSADTYFLRCRLNWARGDRWRSFRTYIRKTWDLRKMQEIPKAKQEAK